MNVVAVVVVVADADHSGHGHVYDDDHLSTPCRMSVMALDRGHPEGGRCRVPDYFAKPATRSLPGLAASTRRPNTRS
jgi:hypothetical protein